MATSDVDADTVEASPGALPAFSRLDETGEWIASRYLDVQAVLADERFEVPAVTDVTGAVGTILWLRASVSRFVNGAEHTERRARAVEELRQLDPAALCAVAYRRACEALRGAGSPGDVIDLMALLGRRVPSAAMAERLGIADPEEAAEAVIAVAGAYFPGADPASELRADAATARLVAAAGPVPVDMVVTRIALMVQSCDATAGLIGAGLQVLQETSGGLADVSSEALLIEVSRQRSPLLATRRVARETIDFEGCEIPAGSAVTCRVDTANRDPATFPKPDDFDPARRGAPDLTFGYGFRPCPGRRQALMLAVGVLDAVRDGCTFLSGRTVDYEPTALRIPLRLDVVLR